MIFYHGTSKENWEEIQKEGVLYGRRYVIDGGKKREISRCTYLATDISVAICYGDIVLEVEYNPFENKDKNNYIDGCWQMRVYEPIPIKNIKKV